MIPSKLTVRLGLDDISRQKIHLFLLFDETNRFIGFTLLPWVGSGKEKACISAVVMVKASDTRRRAPRFKSFLEAKDFDKRDELRHTHQGSITGWKSAFRSSASYVRRMWAATPQCPQRAFQADSRSQNSGHDWRALFQETLRSNQICTDTVDRRDRCGAVDSEAECTRSAKELTRRLQARCSPMSWKLPIAIRQRTTVFFHVSLARPGTQPAEWTR